jgi:hypothetical protein
MVWRLWFVVLSLVAFMFPLAVALVHESLRRA